MVDQIQKQQLLRYVERQIKRREKYITSRQQQREELKEIYRYIENEEDIPAHLSAFMLETIHKYDKQNRRRKKRG